MPLLYWLIAHAVGDYPLQGEHLAAGKGRNWSLLAAHSLAYAFPFAVLMALTGTVDHGAIQVLVASHFVIDALKSRYGLWSGLWRAFSSWYNAKWHRRLARDAHDPIGKLLWNPTMDEKAGTFSELVDQALHLAVIVLLTGGVQVGFVGVS